VTGQWELICHHSYIGFPGVISDYSGAGSHGRAHNLTQGDFHRDGSSPGSGAVGFYDADAQITIIPTEAWAPLDALKAEVRLRLGPSPSSSCSLIRSDTFEFRTTEDGGLLGMFDTAGPSIGIRLATGHDPPHSPDYTLPLNQWVTVGFLYDGAGNAELYADGQAVAKSFSANAIGPLEPPNESITVCQPYSDKPLNGRIDDVKIWRLDPQRLNDDFFSRPVDAETARCLRRYFEQFEDALDRHPVCARLLRHTAREGLEKLRRDTLGESESTREHIRQWAREYRTLWRANDIDNTALAQILLDMSDWLRRVGVTADPQLQALHESECLKTIRSEIGTLKCDPKLTALLDSLSSLMRDQPQGDESDTS
jgi:hypothetical protein